MDNFIKKYYKPIYNDEGELTHHVKMSYKRFEQLIKLMAIIPETSEHYNILLTKNRNFNDCTSWEEALLKFRNPKLDWVSKLKLNVKENLTELGETLQYSPALQGEIFNVSAFIGGDPECFLTKKQVKKQIKKVTIRVNLGYSHKIKINQILKSMGIIISFIKQLEQTNYQVNLVLTSRGRLLRSTYEHEIEVKKFHERIDIMKVVSLLQPSTSRFILHRMVALMYDDVKNGLASTWTDSNIINLGDSIENIENSLSYCLKS